MTRVKAVRCDSMYLETNGRPVRCKALAPEGTEGWTRRQDRRNADYCPRHLDPSIERDITVEKAPATSLGKWWAIEHIDGLASFVITETRGEAAYEKQMALFENRRLDATPEERP